MTARVRVGELDIAATLRAFIEDEALPGTGVESAKFWAGLAAAMHNLTPRNRGLLGRRDELQTLLDAYHRSHRHSAIQPSHLQDRVAEDAANRPASALRRRQN